MASDAGNGTPSYSVGQLDAERDYVNSSEQSPRWLLSAHAIALRAAARLSFGLVNRSASAATETIWLDSTLGEWQGKQMISVNIYVPPREREGSNSKKGRPAIINFHGGGFVLGQGTDDAVWADALMTGLDAVVFSVNYRLAPGYPYPTPPEDCVDAITQISSLADKYGVDTNRIILSGFSAGATLALSSWVILQKPETWGYQLPNSLPQIAGIVLFYPLLDWTVDRPTKRKTCTRPDLTLPSSLTDIFDASYMYPSIPRSEKSDPRLSPGLMPDCMLDQLAPIHLCLCEYDMLLAEGQEFTRKIIARGKQANVRVVNGEPHAWDKLSTITPKESVGIEYDAAIEAMKEWVIVEQSSI
ncbi:Alpha/Beta hydrolase protein [Hypoxylon trugodes]|uniref:Alpha/Beta hydrolase protein n=1 Tax=Hypoxylon trugodes TaxID=326681 RepID=UPI002198863C|nr:Alpha/Beta hydrolase protein [Hypoxylon trugodes]KAI1383376.1 Alpha/Beta hydrolase protein [Hypoxylon trugodes]